MANHRPLHRHVELNFPIGLFSYAVLAHASVQELTAREFMILVHEEVANVTTLDVGVWPCPQPLELVVDPGGIGELRADLGLGLGWVIDILEAALLYRLEHLIEAGLLRPCRGVNWRHRVLW